MKRNILIVFLCFLLNGGICAQPFRAVSGQVNQSVVSTSKRGGVVLGYCNDVLAMQVGLGGEAEIAAAICIPSQMLEPYIGNQIKAIRFGLFSNTKQTSVFIKKDLYGENVAEKMVGTANIGWNEVDMDYTIEKGDLYIGHKSLGTDQIALSDNHVENGLFLQNPDGSWSDYARVNGWNALCLEIVINGENMPASAMAIVTIDDIYTQVNKDFVISGVVENLATSVVNEYEINYWVGDQPVIAQKVQNVSLATNQRDTFEINVPALDKAEEYNLNIYIPKVNGIANSYNSDFESIVHCKEYLFPRKVVVEEGSGTWCQYCVRGIVGMREMRKRYPDTFIGIVSHKNDVMEASSYSALHSKFFEGLPSAVVNRKSDLVIDPGFENLEEAYKKENVPVDMGIEVEAKFTDASKNAISIVTTTTFGFSQDGASYRVALVLLEDSVKGTGKAYEQLNAYSKEWGGSAAGLEMGGFEDLPYHVPAEKMVYEHVARGIYKSFMGNLNSIPSTVEKGESYKFSYEIDKTAFKNANVLDKDKLEVVALLLDNSTGEIVNANKIKVKDYNAVGVKHTEVPKWKVYSNDGCIYVDNTYDELHVFTLNGIETNVCNLPTGIYFVKIVSGNEIAIRKVAVD
ncbi:Omp28-related outer membrane protein [Oscillospiraceae bacterium N12]|jgi:hypothetical protein|uniref:Omp28-related outer membrane protein n=1 Tax=Jilunia laotingensis TaxID=2763675 RepID=A0A926FA18_9BACT|nr:Omp28-related outer membrane protein [Jilunia laotingensis]MBC8594565.1 Omp28-related outer membrane protein [Jilunia laotingensis]